MNELKLIFQSTLHFLDDFITVFESLTAKRKKKKSSRQERKKH